VKKYNEIFGFNRDEDFYHVNFIRVSRTSRTAGFFDFIKNKNERLDKKLTEKENVKREIYYIPCKAKYGDTVFFVFSYNQTDRTRLTHVFKDPIKAIKESLKDWDKGIDGVIYEVVKVKIEPHMCIETPTEYGMKEHKLNNFFNAEGPYAKKIAHAWRSKRENNPHGIIEIDPEYNQDEDLKRLILSLNTVRKFKL
jgi:hypothetical protein